MRRQTQGGRASTNGRAAEDVIAAILDMRGYQPFRQQLVGYGIYDTPIHADFYIDAAPGFPGGLIIESKWQEIAGSADEKLPYLVANVMHCFPAPTIIVLHGGGYRAGAERWLRAQVDGERLFAVLRLEEFLTWCNRNL
jgi:hypothetical protein